MSEGEWETPRIRRISGTFLRTEPGEDGEAPRLDERTRRMLENCPIRSERYQIMGLIGSGAWGTVYGAEDNATGDWVALKALTPSELAKEQMRERGLTEQDVLRKEAGRLVAASNVVPRTVEFDDEENPFIKMPVYPHTLGDKIGDNRDDGWKAKVGDGLTLENALGHLRDVSAGIEQMQTLYGQVHPDLSSANIVLDMKDRALLTDLGSATVATVRGPASPRDNIGAINTRAYECFREGSHPDRRSNSWALGSLAYRLFSGEYILGKELENAIDPAKFMCEIDEKVADTIVKRKVNKNVPKPFRDFLRSCLAHNPDKRPQNGEELRKGLERAVTKYHRSKPGARARRWGAIAAVLGTVIGAGAALWYAGESREEAQEATARAEYERKVEVLREHLGEEAKERWNVYVERGELSGWLHKFEDDRTGMAAYMDPVRTYEAIQETGSEDYDVLKKYFYGRNRGVEYSIIPMAIDIDAPGGNSDNIARMMNQERFGRVETQWEDARKAYEAKKAEEQRRNNGTAWGSGTGISPVRIDSLRKDEDKKKSNLPKWPR